MEPIGQRIKRIMEEKELKQEAVSKGGGMSQSHLSKLIQGKIKSPSLEMLKKVGKGLEVGLQQLLAGTDCESLLPTDSPADQTYCFNINCEKTDTATSGSSGEPVLTKRFYTERYDKSGQEVRYCPFCGEETIHSCPDCSAGIFQWNATYCIGCGRKLFEVIATHK